MCGLKEVRGQHAVFVRSNALGPVCSGSIRCGKKAKVCDVGVFDNLELVLLVWVEETVKGCWGKVEGFGNERSERSGESGHLLDVRFVDGAERGKIG